MKTESPAAAPLLVYVTTASDDEAKHIAEVVIDERLAACANILPGMTSVYRWNDEVKRDDEVVLLLKTCAAHVERLTERVVALHTYECPCVVVLPIVGGWPAYLHWIADETA